MKPMLKTKELTQRTFGTVQTRILSRRVSKRALYIGITLNYILFAFLTLALVILIKANGELAGKEIEGYREDLFKGLKIMGIVLCWVLLIPSVSESSLIAMDLVSRASPEEFRPTEVRKHDFCNGVVTFVAGTITLVILAIGFPIILPLCLWNRSGEEHEPEIDQVVFPDPEDIAAARQRNKKSTKTPPNRDLESGKPNQERRKGATEEMKARRISTKVSWASLLAMKDEFHMNQEIIIQPSPGGIIDENVPQVFVWLLLVSFGADWLVNLLLFPLAYFLLIQSLTVSDVVLNITAIQIFANLDVEFLERVMRMDLTVARGLRPFFLVKSSKSLSAKNPQHHDDEDDIEGFTEEPITAHVES